MAALRLGKLLVLVLFGIWLISETHARPHRKRGRGHHGEKHRSVEKLFQKSCKATEATSGVVIRDVECPDEQQCIMGPLSIKINETDISAMYCDGFKHPPVFQEGKELPKGVCLVESKQGTTLFRWGCKNGDDCQYGPANITFNNHEAEAHFCHDPEASESSEESNEDSSEEQSRPRGASHRRRRPRSAEGRQRRRHHSSEEDSAEDRTHTPREDVSREDHTHSPNLPEGRRPRGLAQRVNQAERPARPERKTSSEEDSASEEDHTESPNHPERPDTPEGHPAGMPHQPHSRRGRSLRHHAGRREREHESSEEDSSDEHTRSPNEGDSHEDHTHSPTSPDHPENRLDRIHSRRSNFRRHHGGGRGRERQSSEEDSNEERTRSPDEQNSHEDHTRSPTHPERPRGGRQQRGGPHRLPKGRGQRSQQAEERFGPDFSE